MSVLDELDFVPAIRTGSRNQAERRYYDFTINGKPLRSMLTSGDNVTPFGWLAREHEAGFARQLLLRAPSELRSGRVPLYICPECADLGCGALTARVLEDHESFAWLDLAFETSYQDALPTEFLEVRPFYFEKRGYETSVRRWWPRTRT